METRDLTPEQYDEMLYCIDCDGYNFVTSRRGEEHRWYVEMYGVYQDATDNTFWEVGWDQPLTEIQEGQDSGAEHKLYRVYPKEITKTIYVRTE